MAVHSISHKTSLLSNPQAVRTTVDNPQTNPKENLMPDMKLTAEVLLRIEGHTELHSVGTVDVPINITFGDKPLRPGMRGGKFDHLNVQAVKVNEDQLGRNIEGAVARGTIRP